MNLSDKRFSKFSTQFKGADGLVRPATVYAYETHNAIYDIVLIEGLQFVRVNMGKLSNLISDWRPIHYAIDSHFHITD